MLKKLLKKLFGSDEIILNKYDKFLKYLDNVNIDPTVFYRFNFIILTPYQNIIEYIEKLKVINTSEWDKYYLDKSLIINNINAEIPINKWYIDNHGRMLSYDEFYILIEELIILINKYHLHIKDNKKIPEYSNAKKMEQHIIVLKELIVIISNNIGDTYGTKDI